MVKVLYRNAYEVRVYFEMQIRLEQYVSKITEKYKTNSVIV